MEPKDEIKQRLEIAELISEYLPLKPAGSGSFKGLCPFHNEKSPSFYVSSAKEIWHCFGCDRGGDLISFVMEFEGMSFPEALRHLGKKAGVEIPEFRPSQKSDSKQFLLGLHELAADYYEIILHREDTGKISRDYLKERGIPSELAKKFRLGFAPDSWDSLSRFLMKKGFGEKRIIEGGLAKRKRDGTGIIDRFRNRLMIPLCDNFGNVLGFTGRILKPQENAPKYLNSPETPIYHKSEVLFGLHLAKRAVRQTGMLIIVEGNLDVVASHKAKVENVVASSGTALTELQLRKIKKITKKIAFAFDADSAGFQAARRGIRLAQSMDFDIRVIKIPKDAGKDPDDVVQKNPVAWRELSKHPVQVMDYFFDKALQLYDVHDVDGKRAFASFIIEEMSHLQNMIEREHWLQKLSDVIHVDIDQLRQMLGRNKRVESRKSKVESQSPQPKKITSKTEHAAFFLIGLVLHDQAFAEEIFKRVDPGLLPEEPWGRIYKELVLVYTGREQSEPAQNKFFSQICEHISQKGSQDDLSRLNASAIRAGEATANFSRDQVRREIDRHINILTSASQNVKRKQLEAAIRQAETSGDEERLRALIEQYTRLL